MNSFQYSWFETNRVYLLYDVYQNYLNSNLGIAFIFKNFTCIYLFIFATRFFILINTHQLHFILSVNY